MIIRIAICIIVILPASCKKRYDDSPESLTHSRLSRLSRVVGIYLLKHQEYNNETLPMIVDKCEAEGLLTEIAVRKENLTVDGYGHDFVLQVDVNKNGQITGNVHTSNTQIYMRIEFVYHASNDSFTTSEILRK